MRMLLAGILGVNFALANDRIVSPKVETKELETVLYKETVVIVDRFKDKCLVYFIDNEPTALKGEIYIYVADCKLFDKLMAELQQKKKAEQTKKIEKTEETEKTDKKQIK